MDRTLAARMVAAAACAAVVATVAAWVPAPSPVAASTRVTPVGRPAPPASSALVPLPELSYAVGKSKIEYFGIEGTTYKELMASLAEASAGPCAEVEPVPSDPALGQRVVAGCVSPTVTAKTRTTRTCTATSCTSACRVTAVIGSTVVHLPRWTAPSMVPSLLLAWWKTVAADIRRHEARHVTIFNQWLPKLRKDAVGKACASWPSISKRWSKKMGAAQAAFDTAELQVAWPRPPVEDY